MHGQKTLIFRTIGSIQLIEVILELKPMKEKMCVLMEVFDIRRYCMSVEEKVKLLNFEFVNVVFMIVRSMVCAIIRWFSKPLMRVQSKWQRHLGMPCYELKKFDHLFVTNRNSWYSGIPQLYIRAPKIVVPTRMFVLPIFTAVSQSPDMPILSSNVPTSGCFSTNESRS